MDEFFAGMVIAFVIDLIIVLMMRLDMVIVLLVDSVVCNAEKSFQVSDIRA